MRFIALNRFLVLIGAMSLALSVGLAIDIWEETGRAEVLKFSLQVLLVVVLGTVVKMLVDKTTAERVTREANTRAVQDIVARIARVHERTTGLRPMMRLYIRLHEAPGNGEVPKEDVRWCMERLNGHAQELSSIALVARHVLPSPEALVANLAEARKCLMDILNEPALDTNRTGVVTLNDIPNLVSFIKAGPGSSIKRFEEVLDEALRNTAQQLLPSRMGSSTSTSLTNSTSAGQQEATAEPPRAA